MFSQKTNPYSFNQSITFSEHLLCACSVTVPICHLKALDAFTYLDQKRRKAEFLQNSYNLRTETLWVFKGVNFDSSFKRHLLLSKSFLISNQNPSCYNLFFPVVYMDNNCLPPFTGFIPSQQIVIECPLCARNYKP